MQNGLFCDWMRACSQDRHKAGRFILRSNDIEAAMLRDVHCRLANNELKHEKNDQLQCKNKSLP